MLNKKTKKVFSGTTTVESFINSNRGHLKEFAVKVVGTASSKECRVHGLAVREDESIVGITLCVKDKYGKRKVIKKLTEEGVNVMIDYRKLYVQGRSVLL